MKEVATLIQIVYNSQRDNDNWGGVLPYWAQCAYTSFIMFLSNWISIARTKEYETAYVDDTEALVGKPGIAEEAEKKYPWIKGRTGAWFYVHRDACAQRLAAAGVKGQMVCRAGEPLGGGRINYGTTEEISAALKSGSPVVVSTKLTDQGHVVLIVGETFDAWILEDPYGDARTQYRDPNGHQVQYLKTWFNPLICEKITNLPNQCVITYFLPGK